METIIVVTIVVLAAAWILRGATRRRDCAGGCGGCSRRCGDA